MSLPGQHRSRSRSPQSPHSKSSAKRSKPAPPSTRAEIWALNSDEWRENGESDSDTDSDKDEKTNVCEKCHTQRGYRCVLCDRSNLCGCTEGASRLFCRGCTETVCKDCQTRVGVHCIPRFFGLALQRVAETRASERITAKSDEKSKEDFERVEKATKESGGAETTKDPKERFQVENSTDSNRDEKVKEAKKSKKSKEASTAKDYEAEIEAEIDFVDDNNGLTSSNWAQLDSPFCTWCAAKAVTRACGHKDMNPPGTRKFSCTGCWTTYCPTCIETKGVRCKNPTCPEPWKWFCPTCMTHPTEVKQSASAHCLSVSKQSCGCGAGSLECSTRLHCSDCGQCCHGKKFHCPFNRNAGGWVLCQSCHDARESVECDICRAKAGLACDRMCSFCHIHVCIDCEGVESFQSKQGLKLFACIPCAIRHKIARRCGCGDIHKLKGVKRQCMVCPDFACNSGGGFCYPHQQQLSKCPRPGCKTAIRRRSHRCISCPTPLSCNVCEGLDPLNCRQCDSCHTLSVRALNHLFPNDLSCLLIRCLNKPPQSAISS